MQLPTGRFKLEFIDLPRDEPLWFDTREELEAMVELIKGCPLDGGKRARLRITEYEQAKVREV